MKKDFNELFEQTLIRKVQEQDPNHVINNNQYKVIKDFVLYYNFHKKEFGSKWSFVVPNIVNFIVFNVQDDYVERLKKLKNLKQSTGITKERCVLKYGEIEGVKRWKQYIEKQAASNGFEYKKEKHGWSKKQYDAYNKKRSSTLENFISRYGEDEGTIKWQEYCDRQSYTKSRDYFIDKYGEKEGNERWLKIIKMRARSQDVCFCMQKYNLSYKEAYKIIKRRQFHRSSRLELDITQQLIDEEIIEKDVYSYFTKQFCLLDYDEYMIKYFDITSISKKKIIEINGDYWHCNPRIYNESYYIEQKDKNAKEIWESDKKKLDLAKKNGYNVFVIWEYDWRHNKKKVIEDVRNFWNS